MTMLVCQVQLLMILTFDIQIKVQYHQRKDKCNMCSVNKDLLFECSGGCECDERLGIELMLAGLEILMVVLGAYNARRIICN